MAAADPLIRGAGRFAPTPTGRLHLGNARTALLAWLAARRAGLRNVLRVEDLDVGAIPEGCLEGQYADLDWLGLRYDEGPRAGGPLGPYRQSERFDRYDSALRTLDEMALLYPCWCSRREVRDAARAPHASDEGPVYPGTCRPADLRPLGGLDGIPRRRGRVPSLRFDVAGALARVGARDVRFADRVAGPQRFDVAAHMGDFVVRRVDGVAAYQLACAWDDAEMRCTQVLRGTDLLPSTARQILLLRVLGLETPEYAHVGLVLAPDGRRLAKRDDDIALARFRLGGEAGSGTVARLAALAGLPATGDLDALTEAFDLDALSPEDVRLTDCRCQGSS